jgi:cell shape-determining protein MreD
MPYYMTSALLIGCLFDPLFGLEDGSRTFLCNLLPYLMASHTRIQYFSVLFPCTYYFFYN